MYMEKPQKDCNVERKKYPFPTFLSGLFSCNDITLFGEEQWSNKTCTKYIGVKLT
jgi:hypothetical protein